MVPEPTMKLIGWAATRTTEAIVDRITDQIKAQTKERFAAKVRRHVRARSVSA